MTITTLSARKVRRNLSETIAEELKRKTDYTIIFNSSGSIPEQEEVHKVVVIVRNDIYTKGSILRNPLIRIMAKLMDAVAEQFTYEMKSKTPHRRKAYIMPDADISILVEDKDRLAMRVEFRFYSTHG